MHVIENIFGTCIQKIATKRAWSKSYCKNKRLQIFWHICLLLLLLYYVKT